MQRSPVSSKGHMSTIYRLQRLKNSSIIELLLGTKASYGKYLLFVIYLCNAFHHLILPLPSEEVQYSLFSKIENLIEALEFSDNNDLIKLGNALDSLSRRYTANSV